MRGNALKRLAEAGNAAKLDLEVGALSLHSDGTRIIGWYSGPYSACGVSVPGMDQLECAVGAGEFRSLVATFDDDDEVTVTQSETALRLATRRRKIDLRFMGEPEVEQYDRLVDGFEPRFEVDAATFHREIRAASEIVSKEVKIPILQGIRFIGSGSVAALEANNGSSLISRSSMDIVGTVDRFEIILPAQGAVDALATLRSEGRLAIGMDGRRIIIRSADAIFVLPTISGSWPKMSQETIDRENFAGRISLSTDTVRALKVAVGVYKASPEVRFVPAEAPDRIVMETRPSELGQFQEEIEGTLSKPCTFDAGDLDIVSRVSGDIIAISVGNTLALVESGRRKTYMLQRVI